jgi:hypothetical protein
MIVHFRYEFASFVLRKTQKLLKEQIAARGLAGPKQHDGSASQLCYHITVSGM